MNNTPPVRGRFAPTPSGRMHIGNVFCALIAWLSVKSAGGEIILRMEDLDAARCPAEYTELICEDLAYLGLSFDQGPQKGGPHAPYCQSERTRFYERAFRYLEKQGLLYPCFCGRDELRASRAPHMSDGRIVYPGVCRRLSDAERRDKAQIRPPATRIMVPDHTVTFVDRLYGEQKFHLAEEWGDFIIRRSDGIFAYQLAVTVDDREMGITEVVRGRDLLSSGAPQMFLHDVFGGSPPAFSHIPLLLAPDGRRLSKRDRDVNMGALREKYRSPEHLIGKLLYLAGLLESPYPLTAEEAIRLFSWEKIPKEDIVLPRGYL